MKNQIYLSFSEREYFRPKVKDTNKRAKKQIIFGFFEREYLRLLAMAESEQAPLCSFGLTKNVQLHCYFMYFIWFFAHLFVTLPPESINCYGL